MATETLERTDEETEEETTQLEPDPEKGELFDRKKWDSEPLALPYADDQQIDRISLKFSGEVFLDRSDPADVALFRKLKLGHDVDLKIQAKVSSTGSKGHTDRDGDLDVVVGTKGLKVHSVDIPAGEL